MDCSLSLHLNNWCLKRFLRNIDLFEKAGLERPQIKAANSKKYHARECMLCVELIGHCLLLSNVKNWGRLLFRANLKPRMFFSLVLFLGLF